jgi:hypothetical protein
MGKTSFRPSNFSMPISVSCQRTEPQLLSKRTSEEDRQDPLVGTEKASFGTIAVEFFFVTSVCTGTVGKELPQLPYQPSVEGKEARFQATSHKIGLVFTELARQRR